MQKEIAELKELLRLALGDLSEVMNKIRGYGYVAFYDRFGDFDADHNWQWQHADRARKVGVEV